MILLFMRSYIALYLRGWCGYFGFCETSTELRDLDSWIRRRLRCVIWKQWKVFRLPSAGTDDSGARLRSLASMTAFRSQGPWRLSQSKAMPWPFPQPTSTRSDFQDWTPGECSSSRTAVYGPVRTVVWEGRGREAPPYPDLTGCPVLGVHYKSQSMVMKNTQSNTVVLNNDPES